MYTPIISRIFGESVMVRGNFLFLFVNSNRSQAGRSVGIITLWLPVGATYNLKYLGQGTSAIGEGSGMCTSFLTTYPVSFSG